MPSTYTSILTLELQANGENSNTWGTKTNTNISLIEQAIAGYVTVTLSSVETTLTRLNGASDQSRNMFIELDGTLTSAVNVILPAVSKLYVFANKATGNNPVVKVAGGTGVTLVSADNAILMVDGATVTQLNTFTTTDVTAIGDVRYGRLSAVNAWTTANGFATSVSATELKTPFLNVAAATSTTQAVSAIGKFDIQGRVSATGFNGTDIAVVTAAASVVSGAVFVHAGSTVTHQVLGTPLSVSPYSSVLSATIAHNLGALPSGVNVVYKCISDDAGFVATQRVEQNGITGGSVAAFNVYYDISNLYFIKNPGVTPAFPAPGTGTNTNTDATKWAVCATPYKYV